MNAIIERCRLAGIRLWVEGGAIRYDAPKGAMTPALAAEIKLHKLDIMEALGSPPSSKRRWQPKRRGLDGYGTPPGVPPLGDTKLAQQMRAMNRASSTMDNEASAMLDVPLDATPPNLPGISPEFAARLSAEDLEDIAVGDIPLGTVQAFEQAAIAREAEDLREAFEERAAILEYGAGLPRVDAEAEAARITTTYARNRDYLWLSLRAALSGYPDLASQVPAM